MPQRVLIPSHFLEELRDATRLLDVELIPYDRQGQPLRDSAGSVALFRWWMSSEEGERLVREHPGLRWIHIASAGIDSLDSATLHAPGVTLTNAAGVHAASIAEWTVGCMLALEKDLPGLLEQQRERRWEKVVRPELEGQTVVILGAGHIAREIARRLRPFGVRLRALRRSASPVAEFDEVGSVTELRTRIEDADWLILAVPLTPETRGLVDPSVLGCLPAGACVVNVSRGEILDEDALVDALRHRRLGGAILDVFEREPLPRDHPLWSLERVIVLPHTTWRSPQVKAKQVELFADNLRRFLRGEPLRNQVSPERGY